MPHAWFAPIDSFQVEVQGGVIAIPYRIYHGEPRPKAERSLSATQQVILHCLYSRHHDGYVRQRHLEQIVGEGDPWVVPVVMQLAGEYVLEILDVINRRLAGLGVPHSAQRRLYGEFIVRNPALFARPFRPARTPGSELLVLLLSLGVPGIRRITRKRPLGSVPECRVRTGRCAVAASHATSAS